MSATINFELTEPQSEIYLSNKRFRCVVAGRRFGKTFDAFIEIWSAATSQHAKDKGGLTIWYVAPTADQARRLMWDGFLKKERYVDPRYVARTNERRMVMELKNGTVISVLSGEEPDHLRGASIDLLVLDECAFMRKEVWDTIYPALTDKYCDGRALLISSPDGYNWFYDIYTKGQNLPDEWDCFHYTTAEGGNVSEKEIETARKTMPYKEFMREYMASFENMSSRVYDGYDKIECDCAMEDDWGEDEIHVGMDFNVNPMTAAIAVIKPDGDGGKKIFFFDEIVEKMSNTDHIAKTIKRKYPRATVYVYPDPTGNKNQTNAVIGQTDMQILKDNGFIVCAPRSHYMVKDKINTVNAAFTNADGEHRTFVVRKNCPQLVKALDGYSYKENGDFDKSTGLDHLTDAMAYLICYRMPFIKRGVLFRPRVFGV